VTDAPLGGDRPLIAEFVAVVDRKPATCHKYRRFLEEAAEFFAHGGHTLLTARRPDVVRFLAYLGSDARVVANSAGVLVTQPLGASSRKATLCALRAFYKHCSVMAYLDRDPTFGVETPKVPVRRGLTIGREAIRAFLDAPGRPRCRVQAHLFVFTAARLASVAGLRWTDIDWNDGLIHFNGKFESAYTLPMHPELRGARLHWREELARLSASHPAIASALDAEETAYVLLTREGRPVRPSTLGKQLKWRAARAGILVHDKRGPTRPERTRASSPRTRSAEASQLCSARRAARSRPSPTC